MTSRITEKDLAATVRRLNETTKSPTAYGDSNGSHIGHYHISHAYGGVSLHRTCSTGGAINDVFRCGHVTKRDLYNRIHAMLAGLEAAV